MAILPFKTIAATLGQHNLPDDVPFPESSLQQAKSIGWAVKAAARHTPWESACLAQAIAAQKLLHRRRIPGVIYLGVANNETSPDKLKAHAWLRCGDTILTGAAGHRQFKVVSTFSWGAQNKP